MRHPRLKLHFSLGDEAFKKYRSIGYRASLRPAHSRGTTVAPEGQPGHARETRAPVEWKSRRWEAHEKYQSALAMAMDDPDAGTESELAVREEGRAYAAALTRYSEATMAWLTYADTRLRPKRAGGVCS